MHAKLTSRGCFSLYFLPSYLYSWFLLSFIYLGWLTEQRKYFLSFGIFLIYLITHGLSRFSLLASVGHIIILVLLKDENKNLKSKEHQVYCGKTLQFEGNTHGIE